MRTVVIGVGNPVRADDGVGLAVARRVGQIIGDAQDVEVTEVWAGGLRLAEAMVGFDRAVVVDALSGGPEPAGTVKKLSLDDLGPARNASCVHDASLPTAIALCRSVGAVMPHEITVWGITGQDLESFREELTDVVARAVPAAAQAIVNELRSKGA